MLKAFVLINQIKYSFLYLIYPLIFLMILKIDVELDLFMCNLIKNFN